MKARLTSIVFTLSFILPGTAVSHVLPTCDNMKGIWKNELGSILQISKVSDAGLISGEYRNYVSNNITPIKVPITGWVNQANDGSNIAPVISFAASWGRKAGSITSWTGYCTKNDAEQDSITTIWNLVKSNTDVEWGRIITNSNTFLPLSSP